MSEKELAALKPCPFCGNDDPDELGLHMVSVMCWKCSAEGPMANSGKQSIAAWNKRVLPAAVERVLKALDVVNLEYAASLFRHDRKAEEGKLFEELIQARDALAALDRGSV